MPTNERRIDKRRVPDHLAYLSLPLDNGGIVTDLSAGGLGFQAIARVDPNGPIHFRFAMDSSTRIRAVGELAWIDKTGKSGGLRFIQLPDEVREQIRIWTGQSPANAEANAKEEAEAGVDDIQVAEPAPVARIARSGRANLAHESNARMKWDPIPGEVQIAEQEIVATVDTTRRADLADEASVDVIAEEKAKAQVDDVQFAEPAILARVTLPGSNELLEVARPNELLYSLKSPIYSAPFYSLSMFPLEQDSGTAPTNYAAPSSFAIPSSFADPLSIARNHPIAAVGLTIVLALLVSIGIVVFLSAILAGDSLFDWGEKAPNATYSKSDSRASFPPSNSAPNSVLFS